MKNEDVDELIFINGGYCRKRRFPCFCAVGWPWERQCPNCRGPKSNESDKSTDWCINGTCSE